MKILCLALFLGMQCACLSSTEKHEAALASAKNVCKNAAADLDKLRTDNPELKFMLTCGEYFEMGGNSNARIRYPMTLTESIEIDVRRAASDRAWKLQHATEEKILRNHHVKVPPYGNCWHFVGIISDEHRITEDGPPYHCLPSKEVRDDSR